MSRGRDEGRRRAERSNREIANELSVALDTVNKHVTHSLDKLGAANRAEATPCAREQGPLPSTAAWTVSSVSVNTHWPSSSGRAVLVHVVV